MVFTVMWIAPRINHDNTESLIYWVRRHYYDERDDAEIEVDSNDKIWYIKNGKNTIRKLIGDELVWEGREFRVKNNGMFVENEDDDESEMEYPDDEDEYGFRIPDDEITMF